VSNSIHRGHDLLRMALLAFAALVIQTTLAMAHASLNATVPIDGAVLGSAPSSFSLTFSEPVAPLALRLVRPDGSIGDLGRAEVKGNVVEIPAPAGLANGTHVLTWRVVSADGHPIAGSVIFSIGGPSAQAPIVEETVDWTVRAGLWLTKLALYVGLFIGAGGVFARSVLMPGIRSGRRALGVALGLGVAGAVLGLGFQGLDALGATVRSIADPVVWSTGLGTSFGNTVAVAVIAFAFGAAGVLGTGRLGKVAAAASLLLAALAPALSGHASAASPQWLMRPAVFTHALGIAVWIGTLIPLGLALRRHEPAALLGLARFSRAMPVVLLGLILAGIALTVVQVADPSALGETAYGRLLLAKFALLSILFAIAALNRFTLTEAVESGDRAAAGRLVRSVAAETLIVMLVFGVAAAWRFTPPPRVIAAAAALPAEMHVHSDKAMADVTVSPGRAGKVSVSAIIMTGEFGALDAKEVTFVFSSAAAGIEPFERRAQKPGDGTWRADRVVLPLPGKWTVRIDILVNDFEMASIAGEVAIRP
jgi:copper transport protein